MITIPELNYQFILLVDLVKGYIDDVSVSSLGDAINILGFVLDAMLAYVLIVRTSAKSKHAPSVSVSVDQSSQRR